MFKTLIQHSWQMLRRSAFFEKSMFAKGFIAFMVFFLSMHLYGLGKLLPGLLNQQFPERAPAEWVYGMLPLILLSDLFIRLFMQKSPASQVKPYLHLPMSRSVLAYYHIFRSWMNPINLYLLVFFYPFIQLTINPATSSQGLGLLGIFLLVGINQSVNMLLRTRGLFSRAMGIGMAILLGVAGIAYFWYSDIMIKESLNLMLAFVHAKPEVFIIPILIILVLHIVIFRQTLFNFYAVYDAREKHETFSGNNRLERFIASVPVYGALWLLEWRLLLRNRRSRSGIYTILPMAIAYAIYGAWAVKDPSQTGSLMVFLIIAGSLGGMQLQHAYSWDSHFFDFLASRNISMRRYVRAKFYFYSSIALVQLILVSLVTGFINFNVMLLFAALTVYACGVGYYVYLRIGVRHSSRFDPEGKASFNMEGVSGMKFISGLLLFLSVIPLYFLGFWFSASYGPALMTGGAGLLFFLTHRRWTRTIAQRLEARKYINLNLYRQK